MIPTNSVYGNYRTRKFSDIYADYDAFEKDLIFYSNNGLNPEFVAEITKKTLYMLLNSRYKNPNIANSDESQLKLRLLSIIYQYGPTWEKRLDIQKSLRGLTEEDIRGGTRQINNHAWNPGTEPSTSTLDELTTTNEQTSTKYTKSKINAYADLIGVLEKDVTEEFLNRFKRLFMVIVEPQEPLYYIEDNEEV